MKNTKERTLIFSQTKRKIAEKIKKGWLTLKIWNIFFVPGVLRQLQRGARSFCQPVPQGTYYRFMVFTLPLPSPKFCVNMNSCAECSRSGGRSPQRERQSSRCPYWAGRAKGSKKYYKCKEKLVRESIFQYTIMQKNMICRVAAEEKEKETWKQL